jgi:hypothetical protein
VGQRASFIVDWSLLPGSFSQTQSVFLRIKAMDEMYPVDITDDGATPQYQTSFLDSKFLGVVQFTDASPLQIDNSDGYARVQCADSDCISPDYSPGDNFCSRLCHSFV